MSCRGEDFDPSRSNNSDSNPDTHTRVTGWTSFYQGCDVIFLPFWPHQGVVRVAFGTIRTVSFPENAPDTFAEPGDTLSAVDYSTEKNEDMSQRRQPPNMDPHEKQIARHGSVFKRPDTMKMPFAAKQKTMPRVTLYGRPQPSIIIPRRMPPGALNVPFLRFKFRLPFAG